MRLAGRRVAVALFLTSLCSTRALAQKLPQPVSAELSGREQFLTVIVTAMMLCGILSFAIRGRVSERTHVAIALFVVLIGGFGLLVLFGGMLYEVPLAAALILLLLVGMFKLMSTFESGRKADRKDSKG
jgi:CHASE2 domain-containing sensor protein